MEFVAQNNANESECKINSNSIFIRSLNLTITDKEIKNYFSQFGPIIDFERFKNHLHLLIIKFENLSSALAAIAEQTHKLNGRKVLVSESDRDPVTTIFFKSFHQTDKNENIRNYFSRFGNVIGIRRAGRKSRHLVWIEFDSLISCSAVFKEREHNFHSRNITIEKYVPKSGKGDVIM